LERLFPERTVYPIYARPVIVGGGNIHCITQQIPGTAREGVPKAHVPEWKEKI
jgi:hypothetical protein